MSKFASEWSNIFLRPYLGVVLHAGFESEPPGGWKWVKMLKNEDFDIFVLIFFLIFFLYFPFKRAFKKGGSEAWAQPFKLNQPATFG